MKIIASVVIGGIVLYALYALFESGTLTNHVQPPVQITVTPFMIFHGYYVHVTNTSQTETITGALVTYTGSSGNSVTQDIGTLGPGESKTLDPSAVNWTVEKYEKIGVSADGYLTKTIDTNVLIGQV